jgi:lipopolysaccharide transport system permease protein
VIQGFRWALLGGNPPDQLMLVSVAMVMVLLVSGLFYFRRMERYFADVV